MHRLTRKSLQIRLTIFTMPHPPQSPETLLTMLTISTVFTIAKTMQPSPR